MKKRYILLVLVCGLFLTISACGKQENADTEANREETQEQEVEDTVQSNTDQMTIEVNGQQFHVILYENETTETLLDRLPMTLNMDEMNGNEKYYFMDESLPTAAESMGTIQNGDVMLYGSDCLVLFFQTFDTSYSYTRIGHIEDAERFSDALTNGTVEVTFSAE